MTDETSSTEAGRDESAAERLDRNTIELLNELRIAGTGIQVMFAFLLVVPFNNRWKTTDAFEHTVYFIALLAVACAAFFLMAPAVHHRILFRHGQKAFLVRWASHFAVIGMGLLAFSFVAILVLVTDVVVGGTAPIIVGAAAGVLVSFLWFALPLLRLDESGRQRSG